MRNSSKGVLLGTSFFFFSFLFRQEIRKKRAIMDAKRKTIGSVISSDHEKRKEQLR